MRVSATTLESFRLWSQPEQEWMSEADLLASIRGEFVPTRAVQLGKAFGQVLEDPDRYRVRSGYVNGGFSFDDDTMAGPLALIDRRGVFEAKTVKAYGSVDVVSMADHLIGAHLSEYKTTGSTFNFQKYAESCQWRFMVDAFEPALVTYHVFCLDDHNNGVVELRSIESFNFFPYADLHQDCCDLLAQFCSYVRTKGLDGMLRQRQEAAA